MPTGSGCGADNLAQELFEALSADNDVNLPDIDLSDSDYDFPDPNGNILYTEPDKVSNESLTTGLVGGDGTYDIVLTSIRNHLHDEYKNKRISANEYTKAYIELTLGALNNSVQFLLGKDTAYWQAVLAQAQARRAEIEAVTARVQLQTAKMQLALAAYQAATSKADYALTKIKLATEDANYCLAKKELLLKDAQISGIEKDNEVKDFNINHLLPKQMEQITEQVEAQRAQTLDTRSDGTPVSGLIGKQKALYNQQIISYERDSEYKAAKMFLDGWITQKTIDEGLLPPNALSNNSVNTVLEKVKLNNNLT